MQPKYSRETLLGNWVEDRALEFASKPFELDYSTEQRSNFTKGTSVLPSGPNSCLDLMQNYWGVGSEQLNNGSVLSLGGKQSNVSLYDGSVEARSGVKETAYTSTIGGNRTDALLIKKQKTWEQEKLLIQRHSVSETTQHQNFKQVDLSASEPSVHKRKAVITNEFQGSSYNYRKN